MKISPRIDAWDENADTSHMPVWGQLRVGRPQIHNHLSAVRRSSFTDDKQPIHAMPVLANWECTSGWSVTREQAPRSAMATSLGCRRCGHL